jgi:hypothetical protein
VKKSKAKQANTAASLKAAAKAAEEFIVRNWKLLSECDGKGIIEGNSQSTGTNNKRTEASTKILRASTKLTPRATARRTEVSNESLSWRGRLQL